MLFVTVTPVVTSSLNFTNPSLSTTKNLGADSFTDKPISLSGGIEGEPEKVTCAVKSALPVPKPTLPELSILAVKTPFEPIKMEFVDGS
jgi:hypothetical protein